MGQQLSDYPFSIRCGKGSDHTERVSVVSVHEATDRQQINGWGSSYPFSIRCGKGSDHTEGASVISVHEATDRQQINGWGSSYPIIRFLSAAARGVIALKGLQ